MYYISIIGLLKFSVFYCELKVKILYSVLDNVCFTILKIEK